MTCAEAIINFVRSSQASSFKKPDSKLLLGMSKAQA